MNDEGFIAVSGCKACGACRDICEVGALVFQGERVVRVDMEKCNLCMKCIEVCPNNSLIYMD